MSMKEDPKKIKTTKHSNDLIREEPCNGENSVQTGLNEDPEMRKIHEANLDDTFDRAESELDD